MNLFIIFNFLKLLEKIPRNPINVVTPHIIFDKLLSVLSFFFKRFILYNPINEDTIIEPYPVYSTDLDFIFFSFFLIANHKFIIDLCMKVIPERYNSQYRS